MSANDLDRYITGNWGEDSVSEEYAMNPNNLEAFGAALREHFPGLIDIAFEGEVEQTVDEDLMTFHEYGWRVHLDNGASFNIVITQHDTADTEEEV